MTCLETTFLIDLLRDDPAASEVAASMDEAGVRPTVTPVVAAEVWVGAYLVSEAERAAARGLVESLTWLDCNRDCARRAGEIQAGLRREGEPIGFVDCLIAAIAIEHGEPLVTRDSDFERIDGLDLVSY